MPAERPQIRKYIVELSTAAVLYAASLFARRPLLRLTPDGPLHTLILLSPIVPVILMAAVIVRLYFRQDEYQRMQFLKMIALCSAVAACLTSSFPFLKDAFGLHDISITFAWPVLGACWFVAAMIMAFRERALARAAGA